jgi:hypothetical protein
METQRKKMNQLFYICINKLKKGQNQAKQLFKNDRIRWHFVKDSILRVLIIRVFYYYQKISYTDIWFNGK